MMETQLLGIVEDTLFITGRGLVIIIGQWQSGQLRIGDWIELRSVAGESNMAQIKSIEGVRWCGNSERLVNGSQPGGLLLTEIDRSAVKIGDEVWSVINPPETGAAETILTAPHKSWWQILQKRT